ncbi:DUF1667 domain-containing protein [Natroniella sulfidigena]|uniref:DUF1667 domain-containing protein n=1 Tax=Natroniella sulfidigena TaxID=723921 RepID=UPI0024A719EB|nr:DUF1667 domain-containing protein [Natroniella sulfidigena]
MKQELITCISCPVGCDVEFEVVEDEIKSIEGNRCPKGKKYVRNEYFNPTRVLPTTVRVTGGVLPLVPVKTEEAIPKELLEVAMKELAKVELQAPVKLGDVVIENILDTEVNVVATRDLAKK